MANGDFYFAINATFYYFTERWGDDALVAYWQAMGREYLAPLAAQFRAGGGKAVARYWADYFAAEPGADAAVSHTNEDAVVIEVRDCPAIAWLTRSPEAVLHPPPHPMYCQHCLHINRALAETAGFVFTIEGGGGTCRQTFNLREQAAVSGSQEAAK